MRQMHDNFDVGPCFVNGKATFGHAQVTWEWFIGGTGRVSFVDAGDVHLIADPIERSQIGE
jgi:hypothetical protein